MTINLLQTPEYQKIMTDFIVQTITYLFDKDQEFAIACDTKYINFSPELPSHVSETFKETVLFVLSGYTYTSATLMDDTFSFEAGFGEENFGSTVTMPILAIKQLFVGENPIVINLSHPAIKRPQPSANSMEALLKNPENQKLLKKKKS